MTSFELPPLFELVRDYVSNVTFETTISNIDLNFDVEAVDVPSVNFDISVILSSEQSVPHKTEGDPEVFAGPFKAELMSGNPSSGLDRNQTLTFTTNFNILMPEYMCTNISFMCVQVKPAQDASYSLAEDNKFYNCQNISLYKLCQGKLTNIN